MNAVNFQILNPVNCIICYVLENYSLNQISIYSMLKIFIYIVKNNETFQSIMFEFTLRSYGGHVSGHAEGNQHGAAIHLLSIFGNFVRI